MSRYPTVSMASLSPEQRKQVRKAKAEAAYLEREKFIQWCEAGGLPTPTPELRFHPRRKWRFDWAWPDQMVALEIEGGAFSRGRHTRGVGFTKDMEKYSEAAALGYRLARIPPAQMYTMELRNLLRRLLA